MSAACSCCNSHDQKPDHSHGHDHDHAPTDGPWWKSRKGLEALGCGGVVLIAYAAGRVVPALEGWVFTAAVLIGLTPIARRALTAAFSGAPFSIEMLMTIAAVGAVAIGAAEEAAAVVLLFLIGELLEGAAAGKARAGIQALAALTPKTAMLEKDGRVQEVAAASLTIGSVVLARPGDRIAADGVVISGDSAVNESPITGESVPVFKQTGSDVFAGTINGDGALRIRATAAGTDNTIARIVKRVEEAQDAKAPTERLINRFARYYTPAVIVAAGLAATIPPLAFGASWDEWIYKGLALLLIGCPCALVISTPAAIAAGLSAGARRGLLLKGGDVLERLGAVTAVAFDKTGTLTKGRLEVADIIGLALSADEVLKLAAGLETGSNHPLAKAIVERAAAAGLAPAMVEEHKAVPGKGVVGVTNGAEVFLGSPQAAGERAVLSAELQAQVTALQEAGKSVAVLVVDGRIAGALALRDEPRDDAASGLDALRQAGVATVMLTGDNRLAAEAMGQRLGIAVRAELSPDDKLAAIRDLQQQGHVNGRKQVVAKVGDGVNDAPALAAADVGIAMGGGTDVALETADAASLHARVGDVLRMIRLSRATMATIGQNIALALGLKAAFFVTTLAGVTGLWPAILADTGATVLVTANSLRLLRYRA